MILLGLTGGIGMGKSAAAQFLRQANLSIVDTDDLARQIVEPGQPALDEIRRRFGDAVIDESGRLRREELARQVFADQAARRDLESILHPRIRSLWSAETQRWQVQGSTAGVVVIPLLFETAAQNHFNAVICIACSAWAQRQRLAARGWSSIQIQQRIQAQLPIQNKMLLSDFVVWTDSDLRIHHEQLRRILLTLGISNP
jgi:dephospho-CoA kinase